MESNKMTGRVSGLINPGAWAAIARVCVWTGEGNRKEKNEKDVSHSGKCFCTLTQEVCH